MIHSNPEATPAGPPPNGNGHPPNTPATFHYLTPGEALPGASRLVSVACPGTTPVRAFRAHNGVAWFIVTDLFKAMGKRNTGMVKRVRHLQALTPVLAWVVNTVEPKASGYRMVQAISESGLTAMLGVTKKPERLAFYQWLMTVAIPLMKTI